MKVECGLGHGQVEEMQVPRWIDNCTAKQSAWLYHEFDKAQCCDYDLARSMERDATETMEKQLVGIVGVCRGGTMTIEINYGSARHGSSTDDRMKGQSK